MSRGALLWAVADMRRRWPSLIGLAVFAGLAAAVAMTAALGARRTESALPRALTSTQAADVGLQFGDVGAERAVLEAPQVVAGDAPILYLGRAAGGDEFDLNLLVASDGGYGTTFERLIVRQGRLADPSAADEVVVTPATASELGLSVGDSFTLETLSPEQLLGFVTGEPPTNETTPAGPSIDLVVVGVGASVPELVDALPGTIYATAAFRAAYDDEVGHVGGATGLGGLARVRLRSGAADFDAYVAAVLAAPGAEAWDDELVVEPLTNVTDRAAGTLQTLSTGALVFAAVAGGAGLIAVGLTLARHVQRIGRDRATLSTLGMTRRQCVWAAVVAITPSIVGAVVIAGLATIIASPTTPFGSARTFELEPGLTADWGVLLGGSATLIIGLAGIATIAAWSSAGRPRSSVRRTDRTTAMLASSVSGNPRLSTGIRLALGRERGTSTLVGRSALLAGVAAVAGLTGGAAYALNLDDLLRHPARWGWTWDVLAEVEPSTAEDAVAAIAALPQAGHVAVVRDRSVVVEGRSTRAQTLEVRKGATQAVLHAGRFPSGPHEIAIGPALSRQLAVGLGETVTVDGPEASNQLTVVGRVTLYPGDDTPLGSDALVASADADGDLAGIAIGRSPGTSHDDLLAALQPLEGDLITLSGYSFPSPPSEIVNTSSLRPVPWALAALLVALGTGTIVHAVSTTLRRRRRDLAVLRALGFRPADERAAIRWQTACVAAISIALGVPLGLIGGRIVFARLVEAIGLEMAFSVSAIVTGAAAVGVAVALQLLATVLGWRLPRTHPAATLRTE